MQSGHSDLSVILQVSAVEGCTLSGVPLLCPSGLTRHEIIFERLPGPLVVSRTRASPSCICVHVGGTGVRDYNIYTGQRS